MKKEQRLLRIGVLGCGPIAQIAHFDACRKARNAELYAICDLAPDLLARMAAIHQPTAVFDNLDAMLADPLVEAVIVATADQFHVPLARQVIEAGKHVLVEKPMGVSVEECEALGESVRSSGLVLQVGHNLRFDPGIAFARRFVIEELGQKLSLKAWYHDSTYRYTMTDNLQAIIVASQTARRPDGDPKADRRRYYLLGHGSHLVDLAHFLGGELTAVRARLVEKFGAFCWFVETDFADDSVGHLDLTIPERGDFQDGFQISGEFGSVSGRIHLPWYHKSSDV
ncbi:MAG TPA: Gfo/Idh/MocA family oxidoreductase, partial [Chloroflexota bacterium]|nr:Gfo/Idh/MocA family oxidoreductase [Chloroflexota bacterium]